MPINIPIVTKVKPIFLDNLKKGQLIISAPFKTAQINNGLKIAFRAMADAIKTTPEDAKDTELRALIVLEATTFTDKTPNDIAIVLPPSKIGQYKSYLKEVGKIVKKGNKQIAIAKLRYEGKMEGDTIYMNVATPPSSKMKMTPVLKWLNKLAKPMNIKFEVANALAEAPMPEAPMPNDVPVEPIVKAPEMKEAPKIKGPHEKVAELMKHQEMLEKKDYKLAHVMQLMAKCQELRVDPKAKLAFKQDPELLSQFKNLRKLVANMLKSKPALYNQLETSLGDPTEITKNFQLELDDLWTNFSNMSQQANTFQDILKVNTTSLVSDVKKFQKGVESQAKGMLEASKLLKIGNPTAISKSMTAIRSGIVKLKETMKAKITTLHQMAKAMMQLEVDFNKSKDRPTQEGIIDKLDVMSQQFIIESKTVSIFH